MLRKMVAEVYGWDNPQPRKNDKEGLAIVLRDLNTEILQYDGTNQEDLVELTEKMLDGDTSNMSLYSHIELLADYCVGKIIRSEGEIYDQMFHYRRLRMMEDQLDLFDDPTANIRQTLIDYVKRRRKE